MPDSWDSSRAETVDSEPLPQQFPVEEFGSIVLDAAEPREQEQVATRKSLPRSFLLTFSGSTLLLLATLFTGVTTDRVLGPHGAGQVAAVTSWALTMSYLGSFHLGDAMTYEQSVNPGHSRQILSTTLVAIFALGSISIVFAELLLPIGFSAQSAETLHLAQAFMIFLPAVTGNLFMWSLIAGHQRFVFFNVVRIAQPLMYASGLVLLWTTDRFTVPNTLLVIGSSYVLVTIASAGMLVRDIGWAAPSMGLTKVALRYGLRLQGQAIGSLGNARLDVTLLPAFVVATQLAFYGLAVSIASIVVVLFGQLAAVVFPIVSRTGGDEGARILESSIRAVLAAAALVAVVLWIIAPDLIRFVFGARFLPAVTPLRILLPGIVFWSGASIVSGGLQAFNRPGRASIAQLIGLSVTVVGLAVTLPTLGIIGAALTSTIAYTTTFWVALALLARSSSLSLGGTFAPAAVRSDLSLLAALVRARRNRERG